MNLRNTLATSAAAAALLAGSAGAHAGDYYVSLFGGLSTFDDEIPFAASQSNSGFLFSKAVGSGTTLAGGLISTQITTVVPTLTSVGVGNGIFGPSTSLTVVPTIFQTTRNVGFYKVVGQRVDYFSAAHQSYFQWEDDFDSGFVVGAAFGAEIAEGWRTELELAYRKHDVSSGGVVHSRFNGNLYQQIAFPTASNFIYRAYNGGNGGFTTTSGFWPYVGNQLGLTSGYYAGLPVSNGSATTYVKVATFTGYGPIPGPGFTFPNAGSATGNFTSSGDAQVWSLMANLWYDFNFMGLNPEGFHTFVGGGLGVANIDLEYEASAGTYFGGTIGYSLDDSAMGFAYQLGGGIGMELGGGMMLSAQYRWFGTSDVDLGNTDMRVESHNAIIGLQIPLGNLSM